MNRNLFNAFVDVKQPAAIPLAKGWKSLMALTSAVLLQLPALNAQDTLEHVARFAVLNASTELNLPWSEAANMDFTLSAVGDVDGNGTPDLALGYPEMDGGKGRVAIAFFDQARTVLGMKWIGDGLGAFPETLYSGDNFGSQVCSVGDLNKDGVPDVAVLSPGSDLAGPDMGAIHLLFLTAGGSVDAVTELTIGKNGFVGPGVNGTLIRSIGAGQDLNGDGNQDLLAGMPGCDLGGAAMGCAVGLFLDPTGKVLFERTYSALSVWPNGAPLNGSSAQFGWSCTGLGDADGDGIADLSVGSKGLKKVINLYLNDDGTIKDWKTQEQASLPGYALTNDFGGTLAVSNDIDQDGANELLVSDERFAANGKTCGAVLYWDADLGSEIKPLLLTSGYAMDGSKLDLISGARFGHSIAVLGDIDKDGFTDVAIAAPGQVPDVKPELIIVSLAHAPVEIDLTVADETPEALGSVSLRVTGGVPPYKVQWSRELFDPDQFNNIKASVDSSGLFTLGIRPPFQTDFTAAELLALVEPRLTNVKAGQYWVGVEDDLKVKAETNFAVGRQLLTLVEIGASISDDKKDVSKSAGDGWTNMQLKTKNLLPKKEDGWVRFTVPENEWKLAVGLKNIDTPDAPGYEHLNCALYFEGNTFRIWNGQAFISAATVWKLGDVFEISRKNDYYVLSVNNEFHSKVGPIDPAIALVINVAIFHELGKVTNITTDFRSSFGIAPTVSHLEPLYPRSGAIELDLPEALGPYEYEWSVPGQTTSKVGVLDPREYVVNVSSAHFDGQTSRTYRVGHKIIWTDTTFTVLKDGIGILVKNKPQDIPAWKKFFLSKNMVRKGAGHYISYRPYPIDKEEYGSIVGVRSSADSRIWAGWWTYSFGTTHIAQTVSRSGEVKRVLVDEDDELEIFLHAYTIHFLKNGELVHQVTRNTEEDSHLILALRSSLSNVRDLITSIPVPLHLNTASLVADEHFVLKTPDGIITDHITGSAKDTELDASLASGPYTISAGTASTGPTTRFHLVDGKPMDLAYMEGATYVPLDASMHEFRGLNEMILYDEPETAEEKANIPFLLNLQDQVLMTPNADGLHDTFRLLGTLEATAFELTIHDLKQNLLFQTADPAQGWNGKFMNTGSPAPSGIYNYTIALPTGPIKGQFMLKR